MYESEDMIQEPVPNSFSGVVHEDSVPVVAFDWQLRGHVTTHQLPSEHADGGAHNVLPDVSLGSCHSNAFRRRLAFHLSKVGDLFQVALMRNF